MLFGQKLWESMHCSNGHPVGYFEKKNIKYSILGTIKGMKSFGCSNNEKPEIIMQLN